MKIFIVEKIKREMAYWFGCGKVERKVVDDIMKGIDMSWVSGSKMLSMSEKLKNGWENEDVSEND